MKGSGLCREQQSGVPESRREEILQNIRGKPLKKVEKSMRSFYDNTSQLKIPRYFKFVDAFPMTVAGKIQKFVMREQSIKKIGLEADDAAKTA